MTQQQPKDKFTEGCEQLEAGNYEDALVFFDLTLELDSNNHEAYCKKGDTLIELNRYQEAIASYDCALDLISKKNDGSYWKDDVRAQLHHSKGKAYYKQGCKEKDPAHYWKKAVEEYKKALDILGNGYLSLRSSRLEIYLEVLQSLTKVLKSLGENQNNEMITSFFSKIYEVLMESSGPRFIRLEHLFYDNPELLQKFASLKGTTVDQLAQSPEPEEQIKALELAERLKNNCLNSLFFGYPLDIDLLIHMDDNDDQEEKEWIKRRMNRFKERWEWEREYYRRSSDKEFSLDPPDYETIQKLLNSETAVIYWYLCPAALTTFILQHNQPLIAWTLNLKSIHETSTQNTHNLQEFEEWIQQWKRNYQNYRNGKTKATDTTAEGEKPSPASYPWQSQMHHELVKLAEILDIQRILSHLDSNIRQLILIPHGDLHLLPLHYVFELNSSQDFTITYLPSAKVGLNLQKRSTQFGSRLLSVEDPETQRKMLYAEIESAVIAKQYKSERIAGRKATKDKVKKALETGYDIFHFTGHAYHNIDNPLKSALALAGKEYLTLKDILMLNLSKYSLVCLSACETGITNKYGLIDEFVGLSSGFLSAGVDHVVSTLWTVNEISAALVMIRFHQCLKQSDVPPALALKKAQQWLKSATYRELSEWYNELATQLMNSDDYGDYLNLISLATISQEEAKTNELTHRPYEDPFHWAGFIITGKVPN